MRRSIESQWYTRPRWLLLLAPLVPVFIGLAAWRRYSLTRRAQKVAAPVIVVGNISVGGTGKTPVIIALVKALQVAGFTPGVISRGYGADHSQARLLPHDAEASQYGDEPVLVKQATGVNVAVGTNRVDSANLLLRDCGCDVILSDDGLQHYRLHRDIELAVIDGARQLGNGWRLPVGPLREGRRRLREVEFVLINGPQEVDSAPSDRAFHFHLQPTGWRNVRTGEIAKLSALPLTGAVAIAGIGNPGRFFDTLRDLGFAGDCRAFADHHAFTKDDFLHLDGKPLLMTEKDAVKCRSFAAEQWWALSVEAQLPEEFTARLIQSL